MALMTRSAIADFLNVGTKANPVWALCGTGFNSLDESPNAQVDSKVYIHEDEAHPSITRYERSFSFDTDVWNEQAAINKIYSIGRNGLTGNKAIVQYLRTDFKVEVDGTPITTTVPARLFNCAVEVSDIQGGGGETLTMSGNLNVQGSFTDGTFNLSTKEFTAGGTVTPTVLGTLTLTLAAGTETGDVKVTVSPALTEGNAYVYKTGAAEITLPAYNDLIETGWETWDGTSDITLAASNYIAVVEVSAYDYAKKGGTKQNGAGN